MILVLIIYFFLWAAFTCLAFLKPRDIRLAITIPLVVLSLGAAGVVAGYADSTVAGETVLWFVGPAVVLATLRLTQATRRIRSARRSKE